MLSIVQGYKIDYVNLKRRGWGQFNYGKVRIRTCNVGVNN